MAILSLIWGRVGWYVLGALAIAAALAGVYLGIRQGGRVAERLEGAQKALEVGRDRRQLDREIESMPDADLDRRLRAPDRR